MAVTFDNPQNLTRMVFKSSGGAVTIRDLTTGDYFNNNSGVGDCLYFEWDRGPWHDLKVNVGTQLVADAITLAWEFWNGVAWVAIPGVVDNTNSFQNAGVNTVDFAVPDDWVNYVSYAGSETGIVIRARITAVTNLTEGGANGTDPISGSDWAIKIVDAATRLSDIQAADTGGGWGVTTTIGSYTAITSNTRLTGPGEFIIRESEILEVGADNKRRIMIFPWTSEFQMGYDDGSGNISEGCMLKYWNNNGLVPYNYWEQYPLFKCYNSIFWKATGGYTDPSIRRGIDWKNVILESPDNPGIYDIWSLYRAYGNMTNIVCSTDFWFYIAAAPTMSDIKFTQGCPGILMAYNNARVRNTDFGTDKVCYVAGNKTCYAEDCKFDDIPNQIISNNVLYIQYNLGLTILDENGSPIATPTVILKNAQSAELFNGVWAVDLLVTSYEGNELGDTDHNPMEMWVTKAGYEPKYIKWDLDFDNKEMVITLKHARITTDQEVIS